MGTKLWGNGIIWDASVTIDSDSFVPGRILEVEVALHEVSYSSDSLERRTKTSTVAVPNPSDPSA